jgi:peptidylprolyl isomerase domain and WD repeat-containing protein 1
MQLARSGGSSAAMDHEKVAKSDALLIALAFRKKRLYVFSHEDPLEQEDVDEDVMLRRDVLNEPPDTEDRLVMDGTSAQAQKMGSEAILRTTMGDIHIKLFTEEVPRTIENFCGHAKSGYYDNVIFHRVIKGFMLQTGDPLGDGTGGESIWGGEFEDEFVRE